MKLTQPGYVEKAPPSLVARDKVALDRVEAKIKELKSEWQE